MGYSDWLEEALLSNTPILSVFTGVWNFYDVVIYGMLSVVILLCVLFSVYQKSSSFIPAFGVGALVLAAVKETMFSDISALLFYPMAALIAYGIYKLIKGNN